MTAPGVRVLAAPGPGTCTLGRSPRWVERALRPGWPRPARWGCVALLLSAALFAARAAEAPDDAAEGQRLAAQREAVEQRHALDEGACAGRFALTRCLDQARERRRAALAEVREGELRLDARQRALRAEERRRAIAAKQAKAAAAPADGGEARSGADRTATAQPERRGRVPAGRPPAPDAGAVQAVEPPASPGATGQASAPAAAEAASSAKGADKPRRAADNASRQDAWRQAQARITRRLADRQAQGRPVQPLPPPPAGSAAGARRP